MKLRAMLLCGALSAATLPAADALTGEFQRALFEEEANRNLPAAIAGYEAVIKRLDEHRQLAATAVFRLGESYRKLGKTNEAVAAYERIIREFADQETLVKLSGQNLSILKPEDSESPATTDADLSRLLDRRNKKQADLQQLRSQYTEENPVVRRVAGELQMLDAQIQQWMLGDARQPTSAELTELRRLEILLETVRSLESMSEEELRTLAEFAGDNEVSESLKSLRIGRQNLETFRSSLREKPDDVNIRAIISSSERSVRTSEHFLQQWRETALRMLEARVEAARRLAGREWAEGQPSSASQLDPATRARQKELLEQEIALVEGQVRADDERYKVGTITTERIRRQRELLALRRQLAALEGTPQAMVTQRQLIEEELKLVDQMNEAARLMLEAGRGSRDDLVTLERERIQLRRELIDLERASTTTTDTGFAASSMTAEEAEELRCVQALAANSPDLLNTVDSSDGQAPLHRAIQKGHLNVVSFLIRNGVDLNRPSISGSLPVHVAASGGQLAALRLLADAGAGLSPRDRQGRTPLHLAIQLGRDSVVSYLLEKGVDADAVNNDGQSGLHHAASVGRTNLMVQLLDDGAGLEIVAPALSQRGIRQGGAEISLRYNGTPLCFAVANGKTEAVELLLERGANVNPPGVEVQPLAIAVTVGDTNMVQRLITSGAKLEGLPLVDAALRSMPDQIPFLLDTGADPNLVRYEWQQPPLLRAVQAYYHWWSIDGVRKNQVRAVGGIQGAVQNQQLQTVPQPTQGGFSMGNLDVSSDSTVDWEALIKAMVGKGANPNAVHECQTVLTVLINPSPGARAPKEMIAWLLNQGANPDIGGGRNSSGGWVDSPLKEACQLGDAELVSLMIKHRADTERREETAAPTALYVAAVGEQQEVTDVLLANGANPNAPGYLDRNPLMELLHRFSGPDAANQRMNGPFGTGMLEQFASSVAAVPQRERKILAIMRGLLDKGARFDGELADGFLPIHYAATKKEDSILKLLLEFKADPNSTNAVGLTPLHAAAAMNRPENIRLLVQSGADVNRPDQNGDTPLHIAAMLNRVQASEVLLELGADRERKNRFDRDPVENLSNVRTNKKPPFGLPEYLDPMKNVTDVLGR